MAFIPIGLLYVAHVFLVTVERLLAFNSTLWFFMCVNNKNLLDSLLEPIYSMSIITLTSFVLKNQWYPTVLCDILTCLKWNLTERRKVFEGNELQGIVRCLGISKSLWNILVACGLCEPKMHGTLPVGVSAFPNRTEILSENISLTLAISHQYSMHGSKIFPFKKARKKPRIPRWGAESPLLSTWACGVEF